MKISTILKFSADWCQPCKKFTPIFKSVSEMEKYKEITFSEVNIEEDENALVEKFLIKSVPTVVFLDEDNNIIKKLIGSVSKNEFINLLDNTIEE